MGSIDINIHPTKTELKFEDERAIYELVKSSVRSALSKNNIAPSIDFNLETSFNIPHLKEGSSIKFPSIEVNPNYNPFSTDKKINVRENLDLIKNNFQNQTSSSENLMEQKLFEEGSYLFLQL